MSRRASPCSTGAPGRPEPPRPDDLLTVAEAAPIAGRSVRTLRRAYLRGSLRAYRDGGGRRVRIEYRDLRDWMKRHTAVLRGDTASAAEVPRISAVATRRAPRLAENLKRLEVARTRRAGSARR